MENIIYARCYTSEHLVQLLNLLLIEMRQLEQLVRVEPQPLRQQLRACKVVVLPLVVTVRVLVMVLVILLKLVLVMLL